MPSWLRNFLTARLLNVILNKLVLSRQPVKNGIPQGSERGRALFMIYINFITKIIKSPLYIIAEESKIFGTIGLDNDS